MARAAPSSRTRATSFSVPRAGPSVPRPGAVARGAVPYSYAASARPGGRQYGGVSSAMAASAGPDARRRLAARTGSARRSPRSRRRPGRRRGRAAARDLVTKGSFRALRHAGRAARRHAGALGGRARRRRLALARAGPPACAARRGGRGLRRGTGPSPHVALLGELHDRASGRAAGSTHASAAYLAALFRALGLRRRRATAPRSPTPPSSACCSSAARAGSGGRRARARPGPRARRGAPAGRRGAASARGPQVAERLAARAAPRRPRRPAPSPSRRRPSVTAATMPRLRSIRRAIVSSIVSAASRYQAVTASCWPMRWQRSSAWSCMRRRPLELEERDVRGARERDALGGDAGRADDQLRPVRVLERADGRLARLDRCRGRAGAARRGSARAPPPAPRRGGRRRRAARRRRGSRGSTPARRASLPRAASRWSVPSCARRSARSVAAIFASSSREVQRLLAQPGDHVVLGQAVLALVVERRPARRPGAWPAAAAGPRTSAGARSSGGAGASAGAPRSAAPWNWRDEARAGAEVLQPADARAAGRSSSSAWLSTGVPVSARRRPPVGDAAGEPAHRLRALGAAGS